MFKNVKILYAEDEDFIRNKVLEILEIMSIDVVAVKDGKEAYKQYLKIKPNIIIADIEMPEMNGLELVKKIRENDNKTQIIITTAFTTTEYFMKAVELNLVKYLLKPIALIDLTDALKKCVENLDIDNNDNKIYFNDKDYYDTKESILFVNNVTQELDYKEKHLLKLLVKHINYTVSYEQIEREIWEGEYMTMGALRTIVKRLRYKLPDNMENVAKIGYKLKTKD